MKKTICILLVLLMLMSMGGCQAVNAAAPAAEAEQKNDAPAAEPEEAEPAPTAQPVLIPMEEVKEEEPDVSANTVAFMIQPTGRSNIDAARVPADMKATIKQCAEYADLPTSYFSADNFKYALLVQEGDFSRKNENCWDELYLYPYNLYNFNAATQEGFVAPATIPDADYGFKTNVECLELYGEDVLIQCVNLARKYTRGNLSCDYTDPAKNRAFAQEWGEATFVFAGVEVLAAAKNSGTKDMEMIANADFASDISLVYQDAEGFLRVRGTVVIVNEHIINDPKIKSGDWYYYDDEVIIHVENGRMAVRGDVILSAAYYPTPNSDRQYLTAVFNAMPDEKTA